MNKQLDIDRLFSPNAQVERLVSKVQAVELPAIHIYSFLTQDEIPQDVFVPKDLQLTLEAMRHMYQNTCQLEESYINCQMVDVQQKREGIFNLLVRCHAKLKLRESTLFIAGILLHRILQQIDLMTNRDVHKLLCAILFIAQKYQPTDNKIYPATYITYLLFGAGSTVRPEYILDTEITVLEMLNYQIEMVSTYHFIHLFGEAARFQQRHMNLYLYLVSLALLNPHTFEFHPSIVAAAAAYIVTLKYNLPYDQNLVFWTGYKVCQLQEAKQLLLKMWHASYQQKSSERPSYLFQKYAEPKKFEVAFEEPLM